MEHGAAAASQEAPPPVVCAAEWLSVSVEPDSGALRVRLLDRDGAAGDVIEAPAIVVDGLVPSGFRPAAQDGKPAVENETLRIELERLGARSVAVSWVPRDGATHQFELRLRDNSRYFGCGERFNALNQRGHILPMVSIDRPESKGSVSYKPVPFYMSSRGYGVWVDNFAPGSFDFNATDRQHVVLHYADDRLRAVLLAGPELGDMLKEFVRLTGPPPLPPAWAFAPWKSRDVHRNRDEVLEDAERTRRCDLPGSVIVIDSPWETGYNDFVLNEEQFRAPQEMFARLAELGFYPCFWLTPFINVRNVVDMPGITAGPARNYEAAVAGGYLVRTPDGGPYLASWWKGEGGLVDFTNPRSVTWWHEQLEQTLKWGVRAFKCDDGEGNFVGPAVFHDGTAWPKMKNRYAELYLRSAQEFIDERLGGDGVLLARCGFTGTQRYPFCWAGDNEASFSFDNGLPSVILAGQNAALSGIPFWGSDIAGYMGTPTKEVFIRWTQFAALCPLMMVHMTSNLGPWDFDEETLAIYRKFAKLHVQLFPYLYNAAHEAVDTGLPIIRPLVLACPGDPHAADHPFQYFLGPDLMVAPMYQGGTYRTVYLPEGRWVDYWSGAVHAGGATIEVHAPLATVPLFVRAGAIIELIPDDVDTLVPRHPGMQADVVALDERRILQIWPGDQGELTSWDGLTAARKTAGAGQNELTITSAQERLVELHFVFQKAVRVAAPSLPDLQCQDRAEDGSTTCRLGSIEGTHDVSWLED